MRLRSIHILVIAIQFVTWPSPGDELQKKMIDAAREGDLQTVQQLTSSGVDVNATLAFNITALWQASSKGHRHVVEFLLEMKADPNARDMVWHTTPLGLTDDVEIVSLLVKHGANDFDAKLRSAARQGSEQLVQAIVESREINVHLLASAKSQAELGSHTKIVTLLEKAAGQNLPKPPNIAAEQLQSYSGKYVSERFDELEVHATADSLSLKRSGRSIQLVPRDAHIFDNGSNTFEFQITNDGVMTLSQLSDNYRERIYTRANADPQSEKSPRLQIDEWKQDNGIAAQDIWPSFRGRSARGIAVGQDLPPNWDVVKGDGVRWKTPIPGLANSCPVVWKDKIFVTTAVSGAGITKLRIGLYGAGDAANDLSKHSWQLFCIDHDSGRILWKRVAHEAVPRVKRHTKSSQANSTPATDGKHVVALFNSGGLHCYDMDGKLLWEKDLGVLDSGAFNDADYQWGFGSSPIIYNNTVIVQCDRQSDSFIAAFEVTTGKQVWRESRDELPSWGTPTVHDTARGPMLIANATNFIRAYDARSGKSLWKLSRNAAITVPTPIVGRDLIFITSGYRPIQPIYAVKLNAIGDISLKEKQISNQFVAWSTQRGGPYLPTPILYGDYFYTCSNNGIFTCYEADTGTQIYRKRCGGGSATSFTASPVAADGTIYVTAEAGMVVSIKAGPKFEILNRHPIGEYCLSTPAIAGGSLLIRTQSHLVAIGNEQNRTDLQSTPKKLEEDRSSLRGNTFLSNGVTAHRGNSGDFPENTISAFQSGIDLGADWIELDIFRTKDGQVVVTHDKTTDRVGDQNLVVSKSTYNDLALVDVATGFRRRNGLTITECPSQKIPLLKDVLRLVMKQKRTRVSIQPKMDCVTDALAIITEMKAERWVGFNDGNLEYMTQVKKLAPTIPVFWDRGSDTTIEEDIRIAKQRGFESLVLRHDGVTTEKIRNIRAAGIEVGAWVVNDQAMMKKLLDAGVERLYTDHPRLLLSQMKK